MNQYPTVVTHNPFTVISFIRNIEDTSKNQLHLED